MKPYPVNLLLEGKQALVVGGGDVAAAKARAMLDAGAMVRVIAPELSSSMKELSALSSLSVELREFAPEDLRGIRIAIAATDRPEVNQIIFEEAERRNIPVCSVDDPSRSNFITPAVLRRGDLLLTVSTSGRAPALASRIRDYLGEIFGEEYADLLVRLGKIRERFRKEYPDFGNRREAWYRLIDTRILPALRRRQPVSLEAGTDESAGSPAWKSPAAIPAASDAALKQNGKVFIVGAGPGDPRLITVRGLECLRAADVIIYDRLVDPSLLDEAPPRAERIYAGKESRHHTLPQARINDLLVMYAEAGKTVVRLKGGDPLVLGRGGEEADSLAERGIPFEFVPGVTSAIAVPAFAGIPVTHRGVSSSFAVVTGHDCGPDPAPDYAALLRSAGTLVILMGVKNLPNIVAQMLEAGIDPDTPVAAIEKGTQDAQQTVVSTLRGILNESSGLEPPATIVIGNVVLLRHRLQWFQETIHFKLSAISLTPGLG